MTNILNTHFGSPAKNSTPIHKTSISSAKIQIGKAIKVALIPRMMTLNLYTLLLSIALLALKFGNNVRVTALGNVINRSTSSEGAV